MMELPFKVDLKDKVVVVTGAGGVLMSAFAEALALSGAKVALLDRNLEAAEAKAKEIGHGCIAVQVDCLSKESIIASKKVVNEKLGKVNFIINGAGGNNPKATTDNEVRTEDLKEGETLCDIVEAGLKFVFDLNITTAFLVTQVYAEDMVETGGNIINISSMNAYRPLTKIPAYSAAKAGLSNFTQWLAVHFAPCNIRVNGIAPGFFSTKQNAALLWNNDGTPTPRTKKILDHTPMKRFGVNEDLIGTLLYLADDKASGFVTGVVIPVDGGFNAYSGV